MPSERRPAEWRQGKLIIDCGGGTELPVQVRGGGDWKRLDGFQFVNLEEVAEGDRFVVDTPFRELIPGQRIFIPKNAKIVEHEAGPDQTQTGAIKQALAEVERAWDDPLQRLSAAQRADEKIRKTTKAFPPGNHLPYNRPYKNETPDSQGGFRSRNAGASLISGRVTVTAVVASPISVYGQEEGIDATHDSMERPLDGSTHADHRRVHLRRDGRGLPVIPGSSLKGALATWFEAITWSHRRNGPTPVGWRYSRTMDDGDRIGVLRFAPQEDGAVPRMQALNYDKHEDATQPDKWPIPEASIQPCESYPVELILPSQPDQIQILTAQCLALMDALKFTAPTTKDKALRDGATLEDDYRLKVAIGEGQYEVNKQRYNFPPSLQAVRATEDEALPVGKQALQRWYAAHLGSGRTTVDKEGWVEGQTWHIQRPDPRTLRDGDLVWYRVVDGEIAYLSRIRGGRQGEVDPIGTHLPAEYHRSCHDASDDPTDAQMVDRRDEVFGFVREQATDALQAAAGRIRVSSGRWSAFDQEGPQTEWFTLPALMSPKPSSAASYLSSGSGTVDWADRDSRLAGTKVYLHKVVPKRTLRQGGFDIAERVRRLGSNGKGESSPIRTATNSTVEAVLNGCFTFSVTFEGVTQDELDALVLSINLDFSGSRRRGWKIGMGKPVGLGSLHHKEVEVEIREPRRDPMSTTFKVLSPEDVAVMTSRARETWIPHPTDVHAYDLLSDVDAFAEQAVSYPGMKAISRQHDGGFTPKHPASRLHRIVH